jgi:multidrug efflux pump
MLVSGMAIGTVFTLFILPVIYLIIASDHRHAAATTDRPEARPAHVPA